MRYILSLAALLLVSLTSVASAQQTCDFSGAPVAPSEARTVLRVRDGNGMVRTHYFGGPAHSFYYVSDIYGSNATVDSVDVVDYGALQDGNSRMIDGKTAWFLFDVDVAPNGTQADPPTVAFSSKAEAQQWQRELGGTVVQGWDNLWNRFDGMYTTSYGEMGDRRGHFERENY
jgi:hypothetical protein